MHGTVQSLCIHLKFQPHTTCQISTDELILKETFKPGLIIHKYMKFTCSDTSNFVWLFLTSGSDLWQAKQINGFSSVQFSRSVMSNSLRPHELQHARPPCPSPTPGVHSDSCPSSQWCHPAISSSVVPFSSCYQSLPASESFPMSQLFIDGINKSKNIYNIISPRGI